MNIRVTALGLLVILANQVAAQTPAARRINIETAFDRFEIVINAGVTTVSGRAADVTSFRDLVPMLTNPIGNACPEFSGQPEVTVTENGQIKKIYISQGLITDGKSCLNVGGDGLLYFPLHRDFLIGPKRGQIVLRSPVKISVQNGKTLELKNNGMGWMSDDQETLLNWDFIERFENSLRAFDVRLRVQLGAAKDKHRMVLQSGDDTYEFYKITNLLWAVKRPGQNWLEASDDWGFWYELDNAILEDRFAGAIRTIEDTTKDRDTRYKTMKRIDAGWSRNLRDLYHKILNETPGDEDFQRLALQRLRTKPAQETAGVVVGLLNRTTNEDLKKIAGQILKSNNPKGPLYNPKASKKDKAKVIQFWNRWWATQSGQKN